VTDDPLHPTAGDGLAIQDDIAASDPGTEPGVRTPEAVSSALTYVSEGYSG
jgi:death-on-curing protein